ncbi:MAG: glycosyltransferase [Muribaculum sp.]|nr:glycosyltransferase [Muribaculum sp.]
MNQLKEMDTVLSNKKRILICDHYLEVGGAERALISLLDSIDTNKYEVDLFLNQHTGEFMDYIPNGINLIPQIPTYSTLLRPIKQIIKEGHWGIALRRMLGLYQHRKYFNSLSKSDKENDESVFQFVSRKTTKGLPSLEFLGDYDLAISFRAPHNIVLDKVKAKRKVCWIHTDYSSIHINRDLEYPIWNGYSNIISISEEVTQSFITVFPELKDKVTIIENILSSESINKFSKAYIPKDVNLESDEIMLLSIGRFSVPKKFQDIPVICKGLLNRGIRLKWYIIGYGNDLETNKIKEAITQQDVADSVIILGKKANPYPYIKMCDWYVQPSLYEGKSVAVREAQLLRKPVIITAYPTAQSQVSNGKDGVIVPLELTDCIQGIYQAITNESLRNRLISYLEHNDLSNISEINKVYSLV